MPRAEYKCHLCNKPLRNLEEAKTIHDRRCPGFRRLHNESVAYVLATSAPLPPPPPPPSPPPSVEMQVDVNPPLPPIHRPRGLPDRRRRPAKLNDSLPPRPARISQQEQASQSQTLQSAQLEMPPTWFRTAPNAFGLYKVYPRRPTHDPDTELSDQDLFAIPKESVALENLPLPSEPWYYPFPNVSVAHMMKYHIEEENPQSIAGFDRLLRNIIHPNEEMESDGVTLSELPRDFSTKVFLDLLDAKGVDPLGINDRWLCGSVKLRMPCVGCRQAEDSAPEFVVDNIYYRPLLDTIKDVLQGPLFAKLHTTPFMLRFDPNFDETSEDDPSQDPQPALGDNDLPLLPEHHEDVYSEVYTSAAMLEAFQAIPQPAPPQGVDDPVESIILAIMEWSDATHLAQFGVAQLWPAYTFFGNHPKDFRGKPTSRAGFHQAYFATLPDSINDSYRQQYGRDMPDAVAAHLKRELMHRTWELLLSDEFMDAYDNGFKIRCMDGIVRLVFPRFFVYAADYPEKVLLATIRGMQGECPCPRCFTPKKQFVETGTANDMKRRNNIRIDNHARRAAIESSRAAIFERGSSLSSNTINNTLLKEKSWVPVRNAFSKLDTAKSPFNLFTMFVPDVMHEVELGVAKEIIAHLIRMLEVFKKVGELDQRFREIETFGRGTIRAFHRNVSELKRVAARDYEDILQCILPVVEGLFPQHQKLVDKLCFEMAVWHGFAKSRMHTTTSIQEYRELTKQCMQTIRAFGRDTDDVKTLESAKEARQRAQRAAAKAAASAAASAAANVLASTGVDSSSVPTVLAATSGQPPSQITAPEPTAKKSRVERQEKKFNLVTYKLHSLPDYPDVITRIGTLDSVSTQTGELAHRLVKFLYKRTNRRDHVKQIAKQEHRRRLMQSMWEKRRRFKEVMRRAAEKENSVASGPNSNATLSTGKGKQSSGQAQRMRRLQSALRCKPSGYGPYVPPEQHHYISYSTRSFWRISDLPNNAAELESDSDSGADGPAPQEMMIDKDEWDPALTEFLVKLKAHLRRRMLGLEYTGDDNQFEPEQLIGVLIEKGLLYTHATMRVNYTTYDLRRDQDVLNPRTRRFFMVHAQDPQDPHRYWYGEILGVFHALVSLADQPDLGTRRIEFLWVRWFQRDMSYPCGFKAKRFPRVRYMPAHSPDAFGFLDPQDVVRGCHLIPAFHHGRTKEYLPRSIARRPAALDEDWKFYYANMVVDRDMLMRYRENVLGHRRPSARVGMESRDNQDNTEEPEDEAEGIELQNDTMMEVDGAGVGGPVQEGGLNNSDCEEEEEQDGDDDERSSSSQSEGESEKEIEVEDEFPTIYERLGYAET